MGNYGVSDTLTLYVLMCKRKVSLCILYHSLNQIQCRRLKLTVKEDKTLLCHVVNILSVNDPATQGTGHQQAWY